MVTTIHFMVINSMGDGSRTLPALILCHLFTYI